MAVSIDFCAFAPAAIAFIKRDCSMPEFIAFVRYFKSELIFSLLLFAARILDICIGGKSIDATAAVLPTVKLC